MHQIRVYIGIACPALSVMASPTEEGPREGERMRIEGSENRGKLMSETDAAGVRGCVCRETGASC